MDIQGVGPVVAARVLADVGDVNRFADRNWFASWTGTAPLDASSGEQNRHRLSRPGNRPMDHTIHIAAISQIRLDTVGPSRFNTHPHSARPRGTRHVRMAQGHTNAA
jgi:transposase